MQIDFVTTMYFFIDKVFKSPFPPTWTNKEREQIAAIKPPPPLPQKKISSFNFIIIYNFTYIKNDSFDILIFIKFKKILVCCFNVYGNFYTKKTGM